MCYHTFNCFKCGHSIRTSQTLILCPKAIRSGWICTHFSRHKQEVDGYCDQCNEEMSKGWKADEDLWWLTSTWKGTLIWDIGALRVGPKGTHLEDDIGGTWKMSSAIGIVFELLNGALAVINEFWLTHDRRSLINRIELQIKSGYIRIVILLKIGRIVSVGTGC
jgi:hypothetical protein